MEMIFFTIVIIALPLFLVFGVVGLAITIWAWGRIGRYFVNFGRWLGDWRNFVPLSILGILSLIVIAIILPIIGFPRTLIAVLIVLLLIVTIVIFIFASVAWTIRFSQWFWGPYRRLIWSAIASMWGALPQRSASSTRRISKTPSRPTGDGTPTPRAKGPTKRSSLGSFWDLMLGRPPQPAKSVAASQPGAANVQPPREEAPAKRSWFGTFWGLMLGKPQPKRRQARPTRVQTTEQTLGPSGGQAATTETESGISERAPSPPRPAGRQKPAKRSWFNSFWTLMMGKPSKPVSRKGRPEEVKARDRADRPARTAAAADAKTGATARVTKTASGEKPAKRGFFSGIWNSVVRGVTFAVGLIILAVLWAVQKVREGIEWIRVRLNLD